MARLPDALRALRHRNFRLFISGQLVSLIGTWMQTVAQSWLVYRLTGQASMLGLVAFAGMFPVFLLATLGGMAADRVRPHTLIVLTQSTAMALTFILAEAEPRPAGERIRPGGVADLLAGQGLRRTSRHSTSYGIRGSTVSIHRWEKPLLPCARQRPVRDLPRDEALIHKEGCHWI